MSAKRVYLGLVGLTICLLLGLVGSAYGINNMLTARATTLTALKAKNAALDQEQLSLANARKEIQKYAELQKITQAVVPEDKDQAEAVRQIVNIAAANGISLASINFPASSLGSAGTGASNTGSGTGAVNVGPVKTSANAGNLSQLQPVKNIPGVYVLQLTVQSDASKPVPYSSFIKFLNALEHNRRTAQISSITLQPVANNPDLLSFTLIINEYIKP
jgi:hypothetical protein